MAAPNKSLYILYILVMHSFLQGFLFMQVHDLCLQQQEHE